MILEIAPLDIVTCKEAEFETAFKQAQHIISAMPGYISHQLHRCLERDSKYILLVQWESVAAHTEGFRKSEAYQEWRSLLHHFYDPFPVVNHYQQVNLVD